MQDFGLDLLYTEQAVVPFPLIDGPRLVRILASLLNVLSPQQKMRD